MCDQLNNLIRRNPVDLSHIVWPRRADGSMDYPPPAVVSAAPSTPEEDKQSELIAVNNFYNENRLVAPNSTKTSTMPLWVWLAVIGGAVVVVGGVILFVVKRKK